MEEVVLEKSCKDGEEERCNRRKKVKIHYHPKGTLSQHQLPHLCLCLYEWGWGLVRVPGTNIASNKQTSPKIARMTTEEALCERPRHP